HTTPSVELDIVSRALPSGLHAPVAGSRPRSDHSTYARPAASAVIVVKAVARNCVAFVTWSKGQIAATTRGFFQFLPSSLETTETMASPCVPSGVRKRRQAP